MNTKYSHINFLWTDLIVDELIRNGIDQFFISPGSRSTPLTLAIARDKRTHCVLHFDERGAGFAALGYARATKKPAVLVCTSGTAAANYFPSIIEASMSRIPMIVLTADRPPELRDTGANQTIDQVKLYGDYVRWFQDLPCPSLDIQPDYLLTTIDQAIYRAQDNIPGPVHLNCMFRDPLAPDNEEIDFNSYLSGISNWVNSEKPYTKYQKPVLSPGLSNIESLAEKIKNNNRGLILCGRMENDAARHSILKFAELVGYPVFADITSGLKSDKSSNIIKHELLFENVDRKEIKTDMVIHFGGVMTSKRLNEWIAEIRPENYIHITNHPDRNDPSHLVSQRFHCEIDTFMNGLHLNLEDPKPDKEWLNNIIDTAKTNEKIVLEKIHKENGLNESLTTRLVSQHIDEKSVLFLGNSLAIRMMDKYLDSDSPVIPIGFNRGASGIDGCIASSLGFAMGNGKPVSLLIGDLSFLHDLNSLAMIKDVKHPITIVVMNNDGGGIFKYLPIAQQKEVFEKYWLTPHGMQFKKISEQFELDYYKTVTSDEFVNNYSTAQKSGKSSIIEVVIN
jgi:2-succinyl-5-enolpyruvyl-6-hydroxy-3-cyclohexene-1-carboxylate synthase